MATPGQLVQAMADVLGISRATVTVYDRALAENGLRSKSGRGMSAARVTSLDAANLLIALAASPVFGFSAKDAVWNCQTYASLPLSPFFQDWSRGFAELGSLRLAVDMLRSAVGPEAPLGANWACYAPLSTTHIDLAGSLAQSSWNFQNALSRVTDLGYVLHINGARIKDIKKGFAASCERAGLEGVSPHTLRHTAATWLMQAGTDVWQASGFLSMSTETLQRVYGHHHPDYQREAAENIGKRPQNVRVIRGRF